MGSGKHLVVFIHGLWGNYKHMNSLNTVFERVLEGKQEFVFLTPRQNAMFKTFDGIEIVGYRTLLEICQFIGTFKDEPITKISIVGYSMGGLIARFVIGKMYGEFGKVFRDIEPQIFLTMATPHLGVEFYNLQKSTLKGIFQAVIRSLGSSILGKTGREMFITNSSNDVLVKLTQGEFLDGLSKFKWRAVVANVKNDRTVAFYTSFITDCDPFLATNNDVKYIFEDKVPGSHYSRTTPRIISMDRLDPELKRPKPKRDFSRWFKVLPLIALFITLILPVMFCLNILATIYSSIVTWRYRKLLQEGKLPLLIHNKLGLNDALKEYATDIYGSLMNEEDAEVNDDESQDDIYANGGEEHVPWKEFIDKYSRVWSNTEQFPKLPLDENRRTMLKNLDTLDWIRVPIYIKSANAHGGIVARKGLDDDVPDTSVACLEFTAQLAQYLLAHCN
ncbi:hypothetical protein HG536_0H02650 [Torulaspora globosa]|uniref:DUF676 domain-containing protein n=1 Tax=Torulaspora globosa TaxID=48254 RepID=A0A7G3ZN04_9SACH|nr:uncharacterized protein HG536_0H02650 [Torulaspora globosa]QLL34890.1 hypothetical protein HG536_0H02650 [Torulaspora globosa]